MDVAKEASQRVRLDIADGVASLTLVREARMNAFDEAMHVGLRTAIAKVADDKSVRVMIVTGSGRAFSAGQDLGERAATFMKGDLPDLRDSLDRNYNPLIRALAELPIPVIAAVNGIAFGAGAGLAIACDVILAAATARFQFGFINVGLGPDSGASWFLPRLVGQARALDLALTGRPVAADEALAIGLVSRVIVDEALLDTARSIAGELAARSPDAITAIKRLMRAGLLGSLGATLDAERDAQAALGHTEQYREAVLRFSQPRK
jgi:2-(1,2-epoxy-1,2-dihydrophenyl)acetyl-CoA isomerase